MGKGNLKNRNKSPQSGEQVDQTKIGQAHRLMFHHLRNKDLRLAVGFYYAVGILLFWFAHPAAASDTPRGYGEAYALSPYAVLSLCINGEAVDGDHRGAHCELCCLTVGAAVLSPPDDASRQIAFDPIFPAPPESVGAEKLLQVSGPGARSPPLLPVDQSLDTRSAA